MSDLDDDDDAVAALKDISEKKQHRWTSYS